MSKDDTSLSLTEKEKKEMEQDVAEYIEKESKVTKDFIQGLIKLGAILKAHKEKWKPKKQYTTVYLPSINRSMEGANKLIRIYEYSLKHMSELLQVNLTNWTKVHLFLALPESLKPRLADKIDGKDVSTTEFRETVVEVKEEEGLIVEEEDEFPIEDDEVESLVASSSLVDVEYMAKQVVKELNNNKVGTFTTKSVPLASGFLYIEKAMRNLDRKKFNELTIEEKKFWNKILRGQLERLNNLFK